MHTRSQVIGRAGGIEILVTSMRRHPRRAVLQVCIRGCLLKRWQGMSVSVSVSVLVLVSVSVSVHVCVLHSMARVSISLTRIWG